jgi:hypothetical protein
MLLNVLAGATNVARGMTCNVFNKVCWLLGLLIRYHHLGSFSEVGPCLRGRLRAALCLRRTPPAPGWTLLSGAWRLRTDALATRDAWRRAAPPLAIALAPTQPGASSGLPGSHPSLDGPPTRPGTRLAVGKSVSSAHALSLFFSHPRSCSSLACVCSAGSCIAQLSPWSGTCRDPRFGRGRGETPALSAIGGAPGCLEPRGRFTRGASDLVHPMVTSSRWNPTALWA